MLSFQAWTGRESNGGRDHRARGQNSSKGSMEGVSVSVLVIGAWRQQFKYVRVNICLPWGRCEGIKSLISVVSVQ